MMDWENRYLTGDTPWVKGRAAPALAEVPSDAWGAGPVLVPGCGLGDDVRALAQLGLPVLGVDIAPTAVERAQSFSCADQENYQCADFLAPGWRAGRSFSAVWEHTCFCAIDPSLRDRYAEVVAECLSPGGMLIGVFFLTPYDLGEDRDPPPWGTSVAELDELFAPWFERVAGVVPRDAYPGREGREWLARFRKRPHP